MVGTLIVALIVGGNGMEGVCAHIESWEGRVDGMKCVTQIPCRV
jgi:hypothetical protein